MAHFSRDSSLIELFNDPHGDVFSMIAARWTGHPEDSICSNERDQTKRLVYGILYGMGQNTLAEQLDCSPDEAAEKIQSFKSSFPGVVSWLHEAVAICRKKGQDILDHLVKKIQSCFLFSSMILDVLSILSLAMCLACSFLLSICL